MNSVKKHKRLLFLLLIPLGVVLTNIARYHPEYVEKFYSYGIYRYIVYIISNITGIIPYSFAELIVYALGLSIVSTIIMAFFRSKKTKISIKVIMPLVENILVIISLLYISFVLIWGLNYYRLPFSRIAQLDIKPASVTDLENLCIELINSANELKKKSITAQGNIERANPYDLDVFSKAYKGYENVAKVYPQLSGKYGKPKKVLSSVAMSYLGISGIYFPYTAEANVNTDIPYVMLPNTISHEMAHQRGFAREDEANYIAYITCSMHPDIDFQYSGVLLALIHSTNALYQEDRERYTNLRALYSAEVVNDLSEINKFWGQYEGPIERAQSKVNDTYLKANNQKDGIKSYGRMIDLLIAEHKKKHTN